MAPVLRELPEDHAPILHYGETSQPLNFILIHRVHTTACKLVCKLSGRFQPLRKALRVMGAPNLLADSMEYGLSYSVVSYLKKLSQQVHTAALHKFISF